MIREKRVSDTIIGSIIAMLFAMILAGNILNNISLLKYFYALAFSIQAILLLLYFAKQKIQVSKRKMELLFLYLLILLIPLMIDLIKGINIDYFDIINVVFKLFYFFFFFICFVNICIDKSDYNRIIKFIIGLGLFACIYSFIFEFNSIMSAFSVSNTNLLNIRSFMSSRNQYSALLVCSFIAVTYSEYRAKSKIFVSIVLIIGVLTTFSRGSLYSILIILLLSFTFNRFSEKKLIFVTTLGLAILLFLLFAPMFNIDIILSSDYIRADSFDSGRFDLWSQAIQIAKEHYFLGEGYYTAVNEAQLQGMSLSQFHNMYLDLIVGGGIPELLFLLYVIYSVWKIVKLNSEKQFFKSYSAALLSFLVYASVESLSLFSLSYGDTLYTTMFITLPLLACNQTSIINQKNKVI